MTYEDYIVSWALDHLELMDRIELADCAIVAWERKINNERALPDPYDQWMATARLLLKLKRAMLDRELRSIIIGGRRECRLPG